MSEHQLIRPVRVDEAQLLHELTSVPSCIGGMSRSSSIGNPRPSRSLQNSWKRPSPVTRWRRTGVVTGYYTITGTPEHAHLDKLFVDAPYIGTGRGKLLWNHAIATAKWLNVQKLDFYADPNAAPFYRAMGAIWTGEEETSRPGWNLQIFDVPL